MICRHYLQGQKLNVADLNEITVLVDRCETELTEVAYNEWKQGLTGPPHRHARKEQIFFILSGVGTIKVAGETFDVKPNDWIFIPAGADHQTIVTGPEPVGYLLFNAFLDPDKEGHASYADHIAKVKETRRKQAETQQADVDPQAIEAASQKKGKYISDIYSGKRFEFGSNSTILLLDRNEAERCETTVVSWPAGNKGAMVAHEDKEQTFFILSGTGFVTVGEETSPVKPGDVVFVPRETPHTTQAADEQLTYLCMNTVVTQGRYENFEKMFNQVAPGRIKRWKEGDTSVGR